MLRVNGNTVTKNSIFFLYSFVHMSFPSFAPRRHRMRDMQRRFARKIMQYALSIFTYCNNKSR